MINEDLRTDLGKLVSQATRLIEACERAIETARTSGHDEILDHLEKIRDTAAEHVQALTDQLEGEWAASPRKRPEPLEAWDDEDVVDEASKESFPASDAPAY